MEEVLFESETRMERAEIADYLRIVADNLESGAPISLDAGGESVTLEVPPRPEFEVKAEREGPAEGPGELAIEFELEWDEDAGGDGGQLSVE